VYTDRVSVKFQITINEDLAAELRSAAKKHNVSLAEFIRQTMRERLRAARESGPQDPFAWMDGLAKAPDTDLSTRVDELLYGDARLR
jgi:hypothetical protein